MIIRRENSIFLCVLFTTFLAFAGTLSAAPSVLQVAVTTSDSTATPKALRIEGQGFGSKADSAPILVDYVSHAFEYGTRNETQSLLSDMENLPRADENPGAVWASWTTDVYYSTSHSRRHSGSKASYFLKGGNAWFGLPTAYGGATGWDTPIDNPQLYVSWWYKNRYKSTWLWRITPVNMQGEFLKDERIEIEGVGTGTYAGTGEQGMLAMAFDQRYGGAPSLVGKKIIGTQSGAVTYFPEQFIGSGDSGYLFAGSKLARIWDDPKGSAGIRSSVAVHDFYVLPSREGYEIAKVYDSLELPPNQWVHLEYLLDTAKGVVKMYADGRLRGEAKFDPTAIYNGKYSPTLSLIGTNGRLPSVQVSEISEIYIDKSWQRVVIGNAPRYSEVTRSEVQRPIQWADTEIDVALNLGALDSSTGAYLYVFDRDNNVNENGVPLCDVVDCGSPPAPVSLDVQ